jgi:predicted AlkP superfamily pyrophosphatase or phosphodiesterase
VPTLPDHALADVTPSLFAALGVPGFGNRLAVPEASAVCLFLIDGLGWELLAEHAADAPFLTSLMPSGRTLTAGFPATTAVSVATLGTGLPAGEHGIVGYTFALPDEPLLHVLTWRTLGRGHHKDMRDRLVPEQVQPNPTTLELAVAAGVQVSVVAPPVQNGSGLTRSVLRGGRFHNAYAVGDLVANVALALTPGTRSFCYAYHGDLDLLGHLYGPGSTAWRLQLREADRLASGLAEQLPPGGLLAVIADHGMIRLREDQVVDVDTTPDLLAGVRLVGGDIRARHVYARQGAAADVLATWRAVLGDRAAVLSRTEAIDAGWFGPHVADLVRPRIGDVVTASLGDGGVLRSEAEPLESRMIGHHGSLSTAEQLVPFLTFRT